MPVERRGWVTHGVCWVNGRPEELSCLAGRRQPSLSGTSRTRRESHVRICERLGVRFPGPTRLTTRWTETALRKPGLKNGARRRDFYEDWSARISILAGRRHLRGRIR